MSIRSGCCMGSDDSLRATSKHDRPARTATRFAGPRLAIRLFLRSFLERPEWLAVCLFALALSTALATALLTLERDAPARVREMLGKAGPNLLLTPSSGMLAIADSTASRVTKML